MKITIKDWRTQREIWSGEADNMKAAVAAALKSVSNLRDAYLRGADLSGADLSGADLRGADLRDAYLSCAYLRGADLSGADLSGAYLSCANLSDAYLSDAYLSCADLRDADLRDAYLSCADLRGADLSGANLSGANLSGADLRGAKNAELAKAMTEIVPRSGSFEGWKKCQGGTLVRLLIPSDAKRSNATGRKCRAEFVEVIEVIGRDFGVSIHDNNVKYLVGRKVRCDKWNEDRFEECGGGIHFYLTREEAEAHS